MAEVQTLVETKQQDDDPKPEQSSEKVTNDEPKPEQSTEKVSNNDIVAPALPKEPEPAVEPPKEPSKPAEKKIGFRTLFTYPRGAYFCLGAQCGERFAYYGTTSVLIMYLISIGPSDRTKAGSYAKAIFHAFGAVNYLSPLLGSVIADGFLGRFKVIVGGATVYCIGLTLLTIGAWHLGKVVALLALFITSIACGMIKPCMSAFAADQFPPDMEAERGQFFSFFYFSTNVGACLTKVIAPILRSQKCLNQKSCFPLAFGVPAVIMVVAFVVFLCGKYWYKIIVVSENIIFKVCKCVGYAIKQKCRNRELKPHWLDHAVPKYEQAFVDDVKNVFGIILLFLPVIVFWALFDQQESTWVLQGALMDGRVGKLTILPDQMGVINPFMIIILIPLFEGVIYPNLAKFNIWTRPLRRMGWGGAIASASFVIAGILQVVVNTTGVTLPDPEGQSRLHVVNFLDSHIFVESNKGRDNFLVLAGNTTSRDIFPNATIFVPSHNLTVEFPMKPTVGYVVAIFKDPVSSPLQYVEYNLTKTKDGMTAIYLLFDPNANGSLSVSVENREDREDSQERSVKYHDKDNGSQVSKIDLTPPLLGSNEYDIFLDRRCPTNQTCPTASPKKALIKSTPAQSGAAHVLVIPNEISSTARLIGVIDPNTISILWQVPQYIVMAVAEILISVSGVSFAYSQGSPKMKALFQSIWMLTVAFGNFLAMAMAAIGVFENRPAPELFTYAILMGIVLAAFILLAKRYKPRKTEEEKEASK